MGASNIRRSPKKKTAITAGTLLSVINRSSILPYVHCFACAIIFLHIILKTIPTSMSPFEGKWVKAWHNKRNAPPHIAAASRHSHRQWEMPSSCPHALHLGSTSGLLPHVPINPSKSLISGFHTISMYIPTYASFLHLHVIPFLISCHAFTILGTHILYIHPQFWPAWPDSTLSRQPHLPSASP